MLDKLALFLRIVEKGGLSAAGRDFGLSPTTVTERLAALEAYYGTSLLNRTTRSISLTDAGRLVVEGARRLLAEAEELESRVRLGVEKISGLIRISAPSDIGRNRISALLDDFLAQHSDVSIDLALGDGYLDLVSQGFDLAVRYGKLPDSSLRVHHLAQSRRIICASPSYMERHGVPQTPEDLVNHHCLVMRFGETIDREWSFDINGQRRTVRVQGRRIANDGALVHAWCLAGHGIARKSHWDILDDLEKGTLRELLAEHTLPETPLQIVYAENRMLPRRVRMLIDHLDSGFR